MKWDPALKTIDPPAVKLFTEPLPGLEAHQNSHYRNLRSFHPGLTLLVPAAQDVSGTNQVFLQPPWRWIGQPSPLTRGACTVTLQTPDGIQQAEAFCKITHIVDPIRWAKGKYSTTPDRKEEHALYLKKCNDPMNQAYVEALTYFCTSKLRESGASPHFSLFYGSFTANAESYRFNVTDEFDSYKHRKWYWNGIDTNVFSLHVDAEGVDSLDLEDHIRRPSFLEDNMSSDEDEDEDDDSSIGDEELDDERKSGKNSDDASLHSADELSFHTGHSDEDDSTDYRPEPEFFMEIKNFPVLMVYLEKSNGVLDDLVADRELVGARPGTALWEQKWSAWLFQVLAACCAMQHTMSLTHNDLHTNNIVWSETTEEYLYYRRKDGTIWKVPTYGKLLRIIDFGRAIFRIKNKVVYSDDFCEGNDAATQYNFGALRNPNEPELLPNPSFDLCRLAVSLFENLFPEEPDRKKGGKVLSEEPGLKVTETTSDLFNILWSWMVTDMGENVLINADGEEKYPSFDLYKVIAGDCHQARPRDQVDKAPFATFKISAKELPQGQKVYSLFY